MPRFIIPLLMIAIIDIYAFQVFKTLGKGWVQRAIQIIYWMIPLVIVFFMVAEASQVKLGLSRSVSISLVAILFVAYITKLAVVGMLFFGDTMVYLGNIFKSFSDKDISLRSYTRPKFIKNLALIAGAIPFSTLLYGILRNAYRYSILRESVAIDNLPDDLVGLKIVQISDIHSGSFMFKEPIRKAINLINKEAADLVFFTGDLVNEKASEMDNLMDVFDKIKAKRGVYSVLGNHDYGDYAPWKDNDEKLANFARLQEIHKELGWDLLMNENRVLDVNNAKLGIIGVENWSAKGFRTNGDLAKAYKGTEATDVKLLLSHDPSHWDAEVNKKYKDIDLTFSGHTHGFQFGIVIPGFMKWSPAKYMYKQWSGLYKEGKQHIYVNRGLGMLGYPGRIGMLPEITVIELKKA